VSKPRLIVIGPLPPPVHGVTVSTSLVLDNQVLRDSFDLEHVDTSDHRTGRNVGTWDSANVLLGLRALATLVRRLGGRRGVVYLPVSQNAPAFLRDSLFIHVANTRGWKVACHLRGSDFRSFFSSSPRVGRRWIRYTLSRASSVAVVGSSLRWVFEGLVSSDRIAVVINGTPEPRVLGGSEPDRVLFLSNLRRRKGVVEAVEAARIVHARRPSARFTFVGDWEDDRLEQELRARATSLNGAVEFRTSVTGIEKERLLASSSVLLFPPVEPEGHPRVVLEALAAGIPVVTTNRGAIRETVADGHNGFVLDEPEPQLLAERVLRLLEDDALRAQFGQAARHAYLERFTQGRADRELTDWLLNVASRA
jgi:glycosyltransferase involved in cell wall biosynthesis